MKVFKSIKPSEFRFWGNGFRNAVSLSDKDWKIVDKKIEEQFPNGVEPEELNNLFTYDFSEVAGWVNKDANSSKHNYKSALLFQKELVKNAVKVLIPDVTPDYVNDWMNENVDDNWFDEGITLVDILDELYENIVRKKCVIYETLKRLDDAGVLVDIDEIDKYLDKIWDDDANAEDDSWAVDELYDCIINK